MSRVFLLLFMLFMCCMQDHVGKEAMVAFRVILLGDALFLVSSILGLSAGIRVLNPAFSELWEAAAAHLVWYIAWAILFYSYFARVRMDMEETSSSASAESKETYDSSGASSSSSLLPADARPADAHEMAQYEY